MAHAEGMNLRESIGFHGSSSDGVPGKVFTPRGL